jgi:hypothetical protein
VYGESSDSYGVYGKGSSSSYAGVYGFNDNGDGVLGQGSSAGVWGQSPDGVGVYGQSTNYAGVFAQSYNDVGLFAESTSGYGVDALSHNSYGVYGKSNSTTGIFGEGSGSGKAGVYGVNHDGYGVHGESTNGYGVHGASSSGYAGYFSGKVHITGDLSKGSGSFKIDHPLDPENKYLQHSFVESPDMMNVYNGNVTLDKNGQAVVQLPEYFEALNHDFRYQLTPIGAPGPNLYIAEKITDNRFKIAGGKSGMEVSWQVTGVRQDPYAVANRIEVEEDKAPEERGYYLHPNAYGLPKEKGIETVRNPRSSQTQEVAKKELSYESDRHYN